jgi:hypothetical protein
MLPIVEGKTIAHKVPCDTRPLCPKAVSEKAAVSVTFHEFAPPWLGACQELIERPSGCCTTAIIFGLFVFAELLAFWSIDSVKANALTLFTYDGDRVAKAGRGLLCGLPLRHVLIVPFLPLR